MDSKFEVFYFSIKGRAEYVRLLLTVAKANWKNKVTEDWPTEKHSTPGLLYRQIPMLIEHKPSGEEFRLVQTCAIIRYLANKFNLVTDCCCKNALLDSYFSGLYEIIDKIIKTTFNTKSKDLPNALKDLTNDEFINNNLSYQEEILASNGSNGYYMGNKITYVDIIAYGLVEGYLNFPGLEGLISKEKTPNLIKVYENVSELPEIKTYLKSSERYTN